MSPTPLESCRQLADDVERHAGVLGLEWEDLAVVLRMCEDFRRSCEEVAGNRGIDHVTIAFTGPKNSGKTRLLSLFLTGEGVRRRLRVGYGRSDATEKVTWIGPRPPGDLLEESEAHIPCHQEDLVDLGFPYTLVDVPGLNEAEERRSEAAVRALDSALVKVLVTAQRELEDKALGSYLARADGSMILPVINFVRAEPPREDIDEFQAMLRQVLPHSEVRPPVLVRDGAIAGREEGGAGGGEILQRDADNLRRAIREAAGPRRLRDLPQARLNRKYRQFKDDMGRFMAERLPASRRALEALRESEEGLPQETLGHLLGADRNLRAGVRQRLRATLLQRTPYVLFPWRAALALANLLHGAVERVPLALMGSIPAWVSGAFTAARNVKGARDFNRGVESGVRGYVEGAVREKILPKVRDLEFVLQREVRAGREEIPTTPTDLQVKISGLDNLQSRSSEIFHSAVERWSPSRGAATLIGLVGFLVFWGFFAWPVYGLYLDFFDAVRGLWVDEGGASGRFPSAPFGMLGTSLLLALLPMGFFMLASVSLLIRPGRVTSCLEQIRSGHSRAVAELVDAGLLRIKVEQPRIDACLFLLKLAPQEAEENSSDHQA